MPQVTLHEYSPSDQRAVDELAVDAFSQFKQAYSDWPTFRSKLAKMSALADSGELIEAKLDGSIVGAVVYVGPGGPKSAFFQPEWAIMRMLVVSPTARGLGIGKTLATECIARAKRDHATMFALHTSPLMSVALPMYLRMGFRLHKSVSTIHGVDYNVYLKELGA
jgi:ribosomal protein S18 acetylase RimI-like enzyme